MMSASILGVFLTVLKIIGFVLAGIIGLALLIVLALLFVPIRYKARFKANLDDDNIISGLVRMSWILHIVNFSIVLEGTKIISTLRIFGIPFKRRFNYEKNSNNDETKEDAKKEASLKIMDLEVDKSLDTQPDKTLEIKPSHELIIEPISSDGGSHEKADIIEINSNSEETSSEILDDIYKEIEEDKKKPKLEYEDAEHEQIVQKNFIGKIKDKINGFKKSINSIINRIKSIPKAIEILINIVKDGADQGYNKLNEIEDFINDKKNQKAYKLAKSEVLNLIKHIGPTKAVGSLNFGFENPATTGRVLGIYYSIFPMTESFNLTGEFDRECFKGDMMIRGHIRLNHILMSFLRLRKNERLVELFKKFTSR